MKRVLKTAGVAVLILILLFYSAAFLFVGFDLENVLSNLDPVKQLSKISEARKYMTIRQTIISAYVDEVDEKKLSESAYRGMLDSLDDKYSFYYTREELEKYLFRREGAFGGIGVSVKTDYENLTIEVLDFIGESPAMKAGIRVGDRIISADGVTFTDRDTMSAIFDLIIGPVDTDVVIGIYRPDTEETLDFTITRKKIMVNNTEQKLFEKTGYIRIESFTLGVSDDFMKAMLDLIQQGATALIVDVRGNGGGSLDEVLKLSDYFLSGELIVYIDDKYGNREDYFSDKASFDLPLVVLTDGNSASASELYAGAMQANGRARVFGVQTFGKGIVQTDYFLADGTAFKITTKKYFLPSGVSIHGSGITPDEIIEQDEAYKGSNPKFIPEEEDRVLKRALDYLSGLQ